MLWSIDALLDKNRCENETQTLENEKKNQIQCRAQKQNLFGSCGKSMIPKTHSVQRCDAHRSDWLYIK